MKETYIDEIRGANTLKFDLRKRWNGYDITEVDAYINRLHRRLFESESVFQERLEELKDNLLSVTRERDALMKDKALTYDYKNISDEQLERFLLKKDKVAVSKEIFKQIKESIALYDKSIKGLRQEQEYQHNKYDELLCEYEKLSNENEQLKDKNKALNDEYEIVIQKCEEILKITSEQLI